jgi:hypothetical protein
MTGCQRNYFWGEKRWERKEGIPKSELVNCIENDLKSMGVMRWRKKSAYGTVWAIIL